MEEQRYRCGQAASELGVSRHIMRRLADSRLIEFKLINGRLYFPTSEVERLKNEGIPTLPSPVRARGSAGAVEIPSPIEKVQAERHPEPQPRFEALYAAPSDKLAKSKEGVLRLQHAVEKKRLQREIHDEDEALRRRREEGFAAQALKKRNARWLVWAARSIPEDCDPSIHDEVHLQAESLLDTLDLEYPDASIQRRIQSILVRALQPHAQKKHRAAALTEAIASMLPRHAQQMPVWQKKATAEIRRRLSGLPEDAPESEVRATAVQAASIIAREYDHLEKVAKTLSVRPLSYDATDEEIDEASQAVRNVLVALPVGASDREMQKAKERAVAPFQAKVDARKASADHRARIKTALFALRLPFEATSEEREDAEMRIRRDLDAVHPTAGYGEFHTALEKAKVPILASIQARVDQANRKREEAIRQERSQREAERAEREARNQAERKAEDALRSLTPYLAENYDYTNHWDAVQEAARIRLELKPRLLLKLARGVFLNDASIERWIHHQADALLDHSDEDQEEGE